MRVLEYHTLNYGVSNSLKLDQAVCLPAKNFCKDNINYAAAYDYSAYCPVAQLTRIIKLLVSFKKNLLNKEFVHKHAKYAVMYQ